MATMSTSLDELQGAAGPVGSSPAEFAAHIKAETARWSEVIKKSNIKAD